MMRPVLHDVAARSEERTTMTDQGAGDCRGLPHPTPAIEYIAALPQVTA